MEVVEFRNLKKAVTLIEDHFHIQKDKKPASSAVYNIFMYK